MIKKIGNKRWADSIQFATDDGGALTTADIDPTIGVSVPSSRLTWRIFLGFFPTSATGTTPPTTATECQIFPLVKDPITGKQTRLQYCNEDDDGSGNMSLPDSWRASDSGEYDVVVDMKLTSQAGTWRAILEVEPNQEMCCEEFEELARECSIFLKSKMGYAGLVA